MVFDRALFAQQAAKMARSEDMTFRGSTKPISSSSVHEIMRSLMSIATGARRRFLDADLGTKKHMISGVLWNCPFRDRKLSATYRKSFDILVENATAGDGADVEKAAENGGSPKWQGRSDSNRGPSVLETDALTS